MCGLVSAGSSWDWAQNEGWTFVLQDHVKKIRSSQWLDEYPQSYKTTLKSLLPYCNTTIRVEKKPDFEFLPILSHIGYQKIP